jgi:uncharacterized protein (TIGR00730 family)
MATDRTADRNILERVDPDLVSHAERIGREFLEGFKVVNEIGGPGATIFGSARITSSHPIYERARETGRLFAQRGFAVITGGGPGVMEAANRGAYEVGGRSVGFNIDLPHEQHANAYVDLEMTFEHFYARKTMLVKAAEGFVLFPGGFGTLDELFESLTLIQNEKVMHFPVVLFGTQYWRGLIEWVRERPLTEQMVSPEDLELLHVTDDPAQAVDEIVDRYLRNRADEAPAEPVKADAQ